MRHAFTAVFLTIVIASITSSIHGQNVNEMTSGMLVPPGMYLAMPAAAGGGFTVGKDGKSITVVDKTGWTYIHTLRIVK